MQWRIIPAKQMDDVLTTATNTCGKSVIKNRIIHWIPTDYIIPIIKSSYYTVHQLSLYYFTCVYLMVLYLFCIKRLFSTCFCSTFKQKIVICMRMCTHGHQTMVTEPAKKSTLGPFLLWHVSILNSNPVHRYNLFCWQVFSGGLKKPKIQPLL